MQFQRLKFACQSRLCFPRICCISKCFIQRFLQFFFAPGMLPLKLFNFASVLLFDTLNLNSMVRNGLGQLFLGCIEPPLQVAFVPGMLRLKLLNLPGVLLPDAL